MSLSREWVKDAEGALRGVLEEFSCQTGTLHRMEGGMLALVAQVGVPEGLWDKILRIPVGKGIAGAAAERREPVELCNLQEDLGGVARPGARATGVSGSVAVPVFRPGSGEVWGTLGVGKVEPYEFSEAEKAALGAVAGEIAAVWAREVHSSD